MAILVYPAKSMNAKPHRYPDGTSWSWHEQSIQIVGKDTKGAEILLAQFATSEVGRICYEGVEEKQK